MAAITYSSHAPALEAAAPKQGFFARFWNAMIEAQMRKAMREIRLHQHLLPAELEISGMKISYKNEDSLPFVRARD